MIHRVVPVRTPYRLDFTVEALRRLHGNIVDVVTENGEYLRALSDARGVNVASVRQAEPSSIDVRIFGDCAQRWIPSVTAMLGTQVDLSAFYRRSRREPWLADLARRFRGLKPPRYPSLWEALCHSIIFQQISILAATAIMRRYVEAFSSPVEHDGSMLYPFPLPESVVGANEGRLRAVGLSGQKASYLKSSAADVLDGRIDARRIAGLPSAEAIARLRTARGIGEWSATVILLRGLGRLDVFPPADSGARRSLRLLSSNPSIDPSQLLESLGDARGMLYFHLLLGRLHPG